MAALHLPARGCAFARRVNAGRSHAPRFVGQNYPHVHSFPLRGVFMGLSRISSKYCPQERPLGSPPNFRRKFGGVNFRGPRTETPDKGACAGIHVLLSRRSERLWAGQIYSDSEFPHRPRTFHAPSIPEIVSGFSSGMWLNVPRLRKFEITGYKALFRFTVRSRWRRGRR